MPKKDTSGILPITILAVKDSTEAGEHFGDRFQKRWRRVDGSNDTHVIFDWMHDRICFTLHKGFITAYPGVSRQQFAASWATDKQLLKDKGISYPVDPKFSSHYLQLLKLMQDLGIE